MQSPIDLEGERKLRRPSVEANKGEGELELEELSSFNCPPAITLSVPGKEAEKSSDPADLATVDRPPIEPRIMDRIDPLSKLPRDGGQNPVRLEVPRLLPL